MKHIWDPPRKHYNKILKSSKESTVFRAAGDAMGKAPLHEDAMNEAVYTVRWQTWREGSGVVNSSPLQVNFNVGGVGGGVCVCMQCIEVCDARNIEC